MSIENIVEYICKIFIDNLTNELPEIADTLQLQDVMPEAISSTVLESCRIFDEYVTNLESSVQLNSNDIDSD